jgi:hypothetical protein
MMNGLDSTDGTMRREQERVSWMKKAQLIQYFRPSEVFGGRT